MNESRDDFLAGSGFAAEQNRRLGLGDLCRALQDVVPLRRSPDDARVLGPGVELLRQRLHARLEPLGTRLRVGNLTRRLGQLLVRHGQRHVIRDPPGDRHVVSRERAGVLRPEREPHVLVARARQHDQKRSESGRHDALAQIDRLDDRQRRRREVVDDDESFVGLRVVRFDEAGQPLELVGRRCLDQNLPAPIVEHHRQQIVREHLVRDLGYLWKHVPDVEHGGDCPQQLYGVVDGGSAVSGRHGQNPVPAPGRKRPRGAGVGSGTTFDPWSAIDSPAVSGGAS